MRKNSFLPTVANYVQQGTGAPVILIHGLAASLHDWDDLIPELTANQYACYALDLLGHGDSPKPEARAYQMDWILDHFSNWVASLHLSGPAILIGHSLGGRVALEYARHDSARTRALILVNPFYSPSQLPLLLRKTHRGATLTRLAAQPLPQGVFRFFVDLASILMGHGIGALHSLPERIRAQTALDYTRTAPGAYHLLNVLSDMTPCLPEINIPTLVVWGDHDRTLAPSSFSYAVEKLPKARGEVLHAGHVPHQSHAADFNRLVMKFLQEIGS